MGSGVKEKRLGVPLLNSILYATAGMAGGPTAVPETSVHVSQSPTQTMVRGEHNAPCQCLTRKPDSAGLLRDFLGTSDSVPRKTQFARHCKTSSWLVLTTLGLPRSLPLPTRPQPSGSNPGISPSCSLEWVEWLIFISHE